MLKRHKDLVVILIILFFLYSFFGFILPGCTGQGKTGDKTAGTEANSALEPTPTPTATQTPTAQEPNAPAPPATRYAYVSAGDGEMIDVYNAETFALVKKMPCAGIPQGMCFSIATKRSGNLPKYLYVANETNVKRFNLETQLADDWNAVGGVGLADVDITPDDKYLYTIDRTNRKIIVTDTTTQLLATEISPDPTAYMFQNAMTQDGVYEVVPRTGWGPVYGIPIIKTDTNTVWNTPTTALGRPQGLAIEPNGIYAYLPLDNTDKVAVLNIQTHTVVGSVDVGDYPWVISITPNGARAYVSNVLSDNISVLDLSNPTSPAVTATIPAGDQPAYSGVSSDGKYVWVPCDYNKIYIIKTEDNTVLDTKPTTDDAGTMVLVE